jgi:hypothetical protein
MDKAQSKEAWLMWYPSRVRSFASRLTYLGDPSCGPPAPTVSQLRAFLGEASGRPDSGPQIGDRRSPGVTTDERRTGAKHAVRQGKSAVALHIGLAYKRR